MRVNMADQNESVDFDFFETPRSPSRGDNIAPSSYEKERPKDKYEKESVKNEWQKSPPPTGSNRSSSPDYSSDSPVSDTDSLSKQESLQKHKAVKNKKKSLSRSSSGSSFSSQSRSRSRSESSRSRSRSSSRSESEREEKCRQKDKNDRPISRRKSKQEEDDYSSSAYSDGGNGKSMNSFDDESTPLRKNGNKQAWGENQDRGGKSKEKQRNSKARPMTAKNRSSEKQRSHSKRSPESDSDTLSDSDITDVSPMESPRAQEATKYKQVDTTWSHLGAAGDGNPVKVQYRAMPVSQKDLAKEDEEGARDLPSSGLDLEILMKAVGELEKQKRVEANTRRVMFAPMTLKRSDKSNYTFDRDKTRDIERENQRLLKEIVRRVNSGDQRKQYKRTQPPLSRMTPSAVNREKEMRRIESENLSILKRLQKIKPTQSISRTNQIRSYENTKLHGIPISTLHPLPNANRRTTSRADDSASSIGSRTRSLTSLHSVSSSVRSSAGSRRSSRPSSATKRIDTRPEWTDRW